MKDQAIAADISRYLADQGSNPVRMQQQQDGIILLTRYRGVHLAIQIRQPGKRMTNKQVEISRQVGRAGHVHIVAHEVADIRQTLATMDAWMTRSRGK